MNNLVAEELNKIIEERCENRNIYQYILKCLEYFKSRNTIFYSYLCNSIFDLLSTYQNFKFVCADSGYFSSSECELTIIQKDIEVGDYTSFIHEITHAIHGLQYSYNVPSEYEYLRNQLISNDNFMGLVCDLMKYIIQSKKAIIEQTIEKSQSSKRSITFEKINKELIIDANKINNEIKNDTDKINKNIKLTSNIYNLFKMIDNITPSLEIGSLMTINNQLNRQFESLIDNIGYTTFVGERFHVLTSMESMIDSILVGELFSGYKNDCFYIEGYGHKKEYFEKNPANSFKELIADYSVLIAYNDSTLIEMMGIVLGNEMSDLLRTSLNSMICKENTNYKSR